MSDWRLFNQDKFLQGKRLFRNHFVPTEQNDHEHCCFCCEKIDQENPEAYCTTDLNDWICLDKSRPGHMMMLIINGILIDPSGSDKYGKNGIGTTNIQEKGHVIGWPDGVVLYDKKYSTIK